MTSEQRQYLKREVDARRRMILAESGDRKFQQPKQGDRMRPLVALVGMVNLTVLLTLALMVEHLAR